MRPEELRNFELTESQRMVRAAARDFARSSMWHAKEHVFVDYR